MKKLSVLTALALMAGSAFAGGVDATDPPDIRLTLGATADGAFDLNDYFSSTDAGSASFSGANIGANGVANVPGSSAAGLEDYDASITVGSNSADVEWSRKVSSFLLDGGPGVDDSLLHVAQGGGTNVFLNCLRAGVPKTSAAPLTGGPSGGGTGGSGTGGSGTPGAGSAVWSITFGSVSVSYSASGQAIRSSAVTAGPAVDTLSAGGLTASINAAGNYTLTSTAAFSGPVVVTFIKSAGDDMDSASVLASAAKSVGANFAANDLNDPNQPGITFAPLAGTPQTGYSVQVGAALARNPVGFTDGTGMKVSAVAGQVVQIFLPQLAVGTGTMTYSISAWSLDAGAGMSLAVFDSTVLAGQQNLAYTLMLGPNEVAADSPRRLSIQYAAPSGTSLPLLQVVGPGTVEFDNLEICAAEAPAVYAYGATEVDLTSATGAGALAGDGSDPISAWFQNFTGATAADYVAPVPSSANNFDTANADGSVALSSTGGVLSNITCNIAADVSDPITVRASAWMQAASNATPGGFVAVVISASGNSGSLSTNGNFTDVRNLAGPGGWDLVETNGVVNDGAIAVQLTLQNAGGSSTVNVDDITAQVIMDEPEYFDATLLGM